MRYEFTAHLKKGKNTPVVLLHASSFSTAFVKAMDEFWRMSYAPGDMTGITWEFEQDRRRAPKQGSMKEKVLQHILKHGGTTLKKTADDLEISRQEASVYLSKLAREGKIRRVKRGVYYPLD